METKGDDVKTTEILQSPYEGKSKNIIRHDDFDTMSYREMETGSDALKESVETNEKKLATVRKLAEDLFYSMYKYIPRQYDDEQIAQSHIHNKNFVQKGIESQEYERLRTFTKLQELESAIATKAILDKLMGELSDEDLNEMNEQSEEAEEAEEQVQKLIERAQGLEDLKSQAKSKGDQKKIQQQIEQTNNQLRQAQQKLQGIAQKIGQKAESMSGAVRQAMRSAMNNAEGEVRDFNEFCAGWGTEAGQLQKMPVKDKLALAEKLRHGKLRDVAKLIGRMKRLALAKQQQKIKKEPNEVVDVCRGDDLSNLLPTEMLQLSDPDLEVLFLKKYANKELLQYELEGKDKLAKGAIVICVDNSGSMYGEPETWSKAVAVGLLEIATKEKRRFACVHFGGENDPLDVTIIEPTDTPAQRIEKIIHMAEYFMGGGTDFQKPLDKAVEIIEQQPSFKKADIVFVTDGCADVSDKWIEKFKEYKKEKEVKVVGIDVGTGSETFERLCERVITLADLTKDDENIAGEVFEFI